MKIQRFIWLIERVAVYTILFLLLAVVIYTLAHDLWIGALVFGILFIAALYKGLICIKIPAFSVVVHNGTVVFFMTEKSVRNRFDFVSRGQTIVELPYYGVLDRAYKLEIFSPAGDGTLSCCRLSLHVDYLLEESAWQKAYDSFVKHQERLSLEVRRILAKSSEQLVCLPVPLEGEEAVKEYLQPIIAELDLGLESIGMKIEEATCTFSSGPTLVRFVSGEQEVMEKLISAEPPTR